MGTLDNKQRDERRLKQVQALIDDCAEIIQKQARYADQVKSRGVPADIEKRTLEAMIDIQVAHIMYREMLLKRLGRSDT